MSDSPERFNLAEAICRRHADRVTRVALLDAKPLAENCYTFGGLDFLSDKFATALDGRGVKEGDAVAVMLAPSAALAVAILGALKRGAVAVPLSPSLELNEIEEAINNSRARAFVAPFEQRSSYAAVASRNAVSTVFLAGDSSEAIHYEGAERSFWRDVFLASSDFTPAAADDSTPAFIFYVKNADGTRQRVTHTHATIMERLAQFTALNGQELHTDDALWCGEDGTSPDTLLKLIFPTWWSGGAVATKLVREFTDGPD